jgi:hypothetical protein
LYVRGLAERNEKHAKMGHSSRKRPKSAKFFVVMSQPSGSYHVHTEVRGPHWIGWVTRGSEQKPDKSIVVVAASQAEAEARARQWAEQTDY